MVNWILVRILILTGAGCLLANFVYALISARGKWRDMDLRLIFEASFWQVATLITVAVTLAITGI